MPANDNDNFDELLYNFAKLYQSFHQLASPISQQAGISSHQWHILSLLKQYPGGITTSELAAKLQITRGAVSQVMEQLALKNLITRKTDKSDRRIVKIYLETDVNDKLSGLIKKYKLLSRKALSCLSESEQKQFSQILVKLESRINQLKLESQE